MPHAPVYLLAALATLVVVSTAIFTMLRGGVPEGTFDTWQGVGGISLRSDSVASLEREANQPDIRRGMDSLGLIPLPTLPTEPEAFATDLADLLSKLTQPSATQQKGEDVVVPSAYAFIPQGLISLTSPAQKLSPEAQALHEYGNRVGITLQAFADLHTNMPQILKDQAEDRANAQKGEALRRLASDFETLGDELAEMDSIPPAAVSTHISLAEAYRTAGAQLRKIPGAQADDAFLAAVNAYNTSAESLSKRLVALVTLFSTHTVMFSSTEPGSIFMFSATPSF